MLNRHALKRTITKLNWALWLLLLVTLPVTSFPFFPSGIVGNAQVRPLSLYPLFLLCFTLVLPSIRSGKKMPGHFIPILLFLVYVIVYSLIIYLQPVPDLRNTSQVVRSLRSVLTLIIGLLYYSVTILIHRSKPRLKSTLRWLLLPISLMFLWSIFEISMVFTNTPRYESLNEIHRWISVRDLPRGRISGFAFEPSWFADQLVILWFPAALGFTAGNLDLPFRYSRFIGLCLCLCTVIMLALTLSRGGYASFLLSIVVLALMYLHLNRKLISRRIDVWKDEASTQQVRFLLFLAPILGLIIFVSIVFVRFLQQNAYFALLWERAGILIQTRSITRYLASIGGDVRIAQMIASWRTFLNHPFLGVGLGQGGFYYLDEIPSWLAERSTLTARLLVPHVIEFPNSKSLWFRLLAETGLLGFSLFLSFLLKHVSTAVQGMRSVDAVSRSIGYVGITSLSALILEGFSLDTFALPYMWIVFGLVSTVSKDLLTDSEEA